MSQKEKGRFKKFAFTSDLQTLNSDSVLGSKMENESYIQYKGIPIKSTFSTVMKKRAKVN